jgi:hypothetical protein
MRINWVCQQFRILCFLLLSKKRITPSSDSFKVWVHPGQFHYAISPATMNGNSVCLVFWHLILNNIFLKFFSLSILVTEPHCEVIASHCLYFIYSEACFTHTWFFKFSNPKVRARAIHEEIHYVCMLNFSYWKKMFTKHFHCGRVQ